MTTLKTSAYQDQMDALSGGVAQNEVLTAEKLAALIKSVKEAKYCGWKSDFAALSDSLKMMKRFPNRPGMRITVTPGSTAFSAVNKCRISITSTADDGDFTDETEE